MKALKKGSLPKKNGQPIDAKARVSQQDVPSLSLEKALRIPRAIAENYGYRPATPLQVARALNIQPTSGPFRALTGAATAYGLTSGGSNANEISLEQLGMRIVRPTTEGDDLRAKQEALLRPRVIREFLNRYRGAAIPRDNIAQNVLLDLGVPRERTREVLGMILEGAKSVSFLQEIKGRTYVEFTPSPAMAPPTDGSLETKEEETVDSGTKSDLTPSARPAQGDEGRTKRVFVTHGKNRAFIEPIKKLLSFGELEAIVSVERQSVSQPVPDKVMNDMRNCGAAIIHIEDEQKLTDGDGKEHIVLNPNVLIEIGAAMALYGRRFILLVKEGINLPSNLQGLSEVRYLGDTLSGDATLKLLEAIKDIKNHPLPVSGSGDRPKTLSATA